MKLVEFARILYESENQTYYPKNKGGKPERVFVWQVLTLKNGFSKTIETVKESITESEFVNIARRPIDIAFPPKLKLTLDGSTLTPDSTERVTFYPELEESWATPQESGDLRIKIFYYEK